MIRRNTSKYTENQESLNQSSFTGLKGIDYSKAPTNNNTVLNSINFDVDYDGGLILRKPLIVNRNLQFQMPSVANSIGSLPGVIPTSSLFESVQDNKILYVKKIFNEYTLYITEKGTFITHYGDVLPIRIAIQNDTYKYYEYTVDNKNFNDCLYDLGYLDKYFVKDVVVTNTSVVLSCQIGHYQLLSNIHGSVDKQYSVPLPISAESETSLLRYLRLTLENEDSKEYILCTVIDTFPTYAEENDIVFDYNLYSEYPLAIKDNYGSAYWRIGGFLTYKIPTSKDDNGKDNTTTKSVRFLTQNAQNKIAYSITKKGAGNGNRILIKAFMDFKYSDEYYTDSYSPNYSERVYACWDRTLNGIDWESCNNVFCYESSIGAREPINVKSSLDDSTTLEYRYFKAYPLFTTSTKDGIQLKLASEDAEIRYRPDILQISKDNEALKSYTYRFRIFTLGKKNTVTNEDATTSVVYDIGTVLSEKSYTPTYSDTYVEVPNDLPNAISDNMLYHKKRLYNFGKTSKNIITVSDTDSTETPYSNIIDLDTTEDTYVTSLTPWRDYLIASTDKTIHLITAQDIGFTTKTISTYIGIPEKDGKTCVSIMNGILFKSGDKIYTLYPDASSGNETILNIHDISKPIEHLLGKESTSKKNFAFSTSTAYYVFIPQDDVKNENGAVISVNTLCLKYDFTRKIWTQYTYPVDIFDYCIENVSDIKLFARTVSGIVYEFIFEQDILTDGEYGDCLTTDLSERTPIQFLLDSGQKTDNISLTKQFVESKIIVATLDSKDSFAMNVNIDIDGNAFVKHIDLNTDGALIRSNSHQTLTLGTAQDYSLGADTFNTNRQMFLRYAGKGKTIRHIISGQSLYKFKIYETFYRYKILNVKQ